MRDLLETVLSVLVVVGGLGFLLTLTVGIPAVFGAGYRDHQRPGRRRRAVALNARVFKIGVLFFALLDIGRWGLMLLGSGLLG